VSINYPIATNIHLNCTYDDRSDQKPCYPLLDNNGVVARLQSISNYKRDYNKYQIILFHGKNYFLRQLFGPKQKLPVAAPVIILIAIPAQPG